MAVSTAEGQHTEEWLSVMGLNAGQSLQKYSAETVGDDQPSNARLARLSTR